MTIKLYKEPTILVIVSLIAIISVISLMIRGPMSDSVTVDHHVPTSIQVGNHKNPSYTAHTTQQSTAKLPSTISNSSSSAKLISTFGGN